MIDRDHKPPFTYHLFYESSFSYSPGQEAATMRRLRYCVAMSLDGYIAGPQGEADWIVIDAEIDFDGLFAQFDTLLMGRRTFAAAGGGGSTPGMRVVVASRTLAADAAPGATVVGEEQLGPTVAALKAEPGKDIWLFGGGELFRSLLALDLVDTVEVGVIPVLLGSGIPLLPALDRRTRLTLTAHRVYAKTGTVGLEYAVAKPPARRRRAGAPPTARKGRRTSGKTT
jgi:dihydrofolate reductase